MESNINHIISRVLSGEATSEDILSLSNWLNEDEKNQEEFRHLKSYWDAEVTYNKEISANVSIAKLEQNIQGQIMHLNGKRSFHTIFSIAAAIVILIALSVTYYFYHSSQNQTAQNYYTYMAGDNQSSFVLKDGTVITLNKNSQLTISNLYGKRVRSVKLTGEAYFNVAKNPAKPFKVEMGNASITVIGTHFDVITDAKSDEIIATLVEGSIKFRGAEQTIIMTPNQQLTFNRSTNKVNLESVDSDVTTAWKNGVLKYKSISFSQLISNLRDSYQVDIRIKNAKLLDPNVKVSGAFDENQSIEQVLKVISRSLPIKWYCNNGVYYIK